MLHYNQPLEHLEKSESLEKGAGLWPGVEAPVGASELVTVMELALVSGVEACHPSGTATGDLVLASATASETVLVLEGAGGRGSEKESAMGLVGASVGGPARGSGCSAL